MMHLCQLTVVAVSRLLIAARTLMVRISPERIPALELRVETRVLSVLMNYSPVS